MGFNLDMLKNLCMLYDIKVLYAELPEDLLGKANAGTKTITLNILLKDNPRAEKCVLLEEIGHIIIPPRPGHIRYHSKGFYKREDCSLIRHTVAQDERKARDWATNVLLGNVDISHIKSVGASSINELANYFDVEPWFMEHWIGYLRRTARGNRQRIKWRDVIQRF